MTHARINYTLVIPTYNRHAWLAALLTYLERMRVKFPVLVLDSSDMEDADKNRSMIAGLSLHVDYRPYPSTTAFRQKLYDGLMNVETRYCSLCADDDIIIPDAIDKCVEHLERHPDHVGAQGLYFAFSESERRYFVDDVPYDYLSLDHENAIERIAFLFKDYQSNFYAIYRTEVQRRVFSIIVRQENSLFFEIMQSALTSAMGKVRRIPVVYAGRRRSPSAGNPTCWHPVEWLAADPEGLLGAYAKYRNELLEFLSALPEVAQGYSRAEVGRILDLVHVRYVFASIKEQGLSAAISAHLARKDRVETVAEAFKASVLPASAIESPVRYFARCVLLRARHVASRLRLMYPALWGKRLGGGRTFQDQFAWQGEHCIVGGNGAAIKKLQAFDANLLETGQLVICHTLDAYAAARHTL